MTLPGFPTIAIPGNLLEPADLRVITREGKRIMGRYIGLDGLTGLSLISLANGSLPQIVDSKGESISVGQELRVIGPQPAPRTETGARTAMYVRIGETEAVVINVSRSPSGSIARVKIKSAKLTPANIGASQLTMPEKRLGLLTALKATKPQSCP